MYQIARLLISVSPAIIGLYLLFGILANISASNAAANWPVVSGIVTETQVSGMFALYDRQSHISYEYQVEGVRYTGNKVAFGNGGVSGYGVNQAVNVYVNSLNHQESVLEVGFRLRYLITVLIGVGLIMVGWLLWKRLD